MEEKKTARQYKRTLRSTVGTGMSALVGGNGRRFYVLEHRDNSKYHKAGDSQRIIVDQIELGCNPDCQVRFDQDSWGIVSRRHAAIERNGDRWKLIHLSRTNSTFVNGSKVETERYLENGDEIRLADGGPRIGFIAPEGRQGLVSSIKLTERMELFRKQALKPYKWAIAAMFSALLIICGITSYIIYGQGLEIKDLLNKANVQAKMFADAKDKWKEDSIDMVNRIANIKPVTKVTKVIVNKGENEKSTEKQLEAVKSSVYAVITEVYVATDSEKQRVAMSQGTGFLLEDGRFVTARHCVEPWMFDNRKLQEYFALSKTLPDKIKIYAEIVAINNQGDQLPFRDNNFKVDRTGDVENDVQYELEGETYTLKGGLAVGTTMSLGNDWAYAHTSKKGSIIDGKSISSSLKGGKAAHLWGFPMGLGILDGKNIVDPIYRGVSISRDGLNDARCIMISHGVDHGNSGGPVFVMNDNKLVVIGIVSRGDSNSDMYNHVVPMSNLK